MIKVTLAGNSRRYYASFQGIIKYSLNGYQHNNKQSTRRQFTCSKRGKFRRKQYIQIYLNNEKYLAD